MNIKILFPLGILGSITLNTYLRIKSCNKMFDKMVVNQNNIQVYNIKLWSGFSCSFLDQLIIKYNINEYFNKNNESILNIEKKISPLQIDKVYSDLVSDGELFTEYTLKKNTCVDDKLDLKLIYLKKYHSIWLIK